MKEKVIIPNWGETLPVERREIQIFPPVAPVETETERKLREVRQELASYIK